MILRKSFSGLTQHEPLFHVISEYNDELSPPACLTCREGGEDDPVVERLRRPVVVLQQSPDGILRFSGVKYRLHPQQLSGEVKRRGMEKNCLQTLHLKHKVSD